MRIFKNKPFNRYARKKNITDDDLSAAVVEIKNGLVEADYDGNLFKKRIARKGEGRSGGHRVILAYVKDDKTFFMYGFEKSDRDNIKKNEARDYKKLVKLYTSLSDEQLTLAKDENVLFEVILDEKNL